MRSVKYFLLSFLLTLSPVAADVANAQNLARNLANQGSLPVNVRLRLQILAQQLPNIKRNDQAANILGFFSTTRVMVWNQAPAQGVGATMEELERNMVQLAQAQGRSLDLPPVGYSPAPGGSRAANLIHRELITRNGLSELVLQTEQVATELVVANPTAMDLLYLRDSLTHLRQDIADPAVAAASLRRVLEARARFLVSDDSTRIQDERLMRGLASLSEMVRGTFPPERLRTAGSIQIPFD